VKKRNIRLNTDSHRLAFDQFAEFLQAIGRREGWRSSQVLRTFLEAGFRAVRGRLLAGEAFERNEAEYLRLVKSCRHPDETMADLSRMLGALGCAMAAEPIDFLGPVFEELSAAAEFGQFFTPYHLSALMARMILPDAKATLGDRPYLTLSEPACGVGGMVLATNQILREQGLDVARQAHWHVTDTDYRAIAGCYLQLAFSDASALVIRGNTLAPSPHDDASLTPAAVVFPKLFSREKLPPNEPAAPESGTAQLSLF
jgi:hypothetical protein